MVGRVWPRHGHRGRLLNSVVRVLTKDAVVAKLNAALAQTSDVYVNAGVDENEYFERLRRSIRQHQCEPYLLSATVMPPAFPGIEPGRTITGYCVAKNEKAGYWLIYSPDADIFYCFWGTSESNLGAHGVLGSPLYCWSA